MKKKIVLLFCLIISLILPVSGQNTKTRPPKPKSSVTAKSFRLFEDESLLEISLRFDMNAYIKLRPDKDYLNAIMTIHLNKTDSLSAKIRLRTRGIFRNKKEICYFAPIELNLRKAKFGYSDLDKISKMKMVPQCNLGNDYENYTLREYLIYKMFNIVTDTSFRVRLLKVNYIDSEMKKKPISQYAFLIEPLEMVATRTNCIQVSSPAINQKNIFPWEMDQVAIFNYMIGNYDWAVPNQHNIRVLKPLKADTIQLGYAIPYDFDFTGFVNPPYAVPADNVGIKTVRQRIFLGICRSREVYLNDLELFKDKKDEFYKLIDGFPYLSQRSKKDMTQYLEEFFSQCSGRKEILNIFLNGCKKI